MKNTVSTFTRTGLSGGEQAGLQDSAGNKCRRSTEQKGFPLRMAGEGEHVRIVSLSAGKALHDRLAGLGLHIGEQVEIIQNRSNGKLLLGHGNTRFFLGGGMAWKIRVVTV